MSVLQTYKQKSQSQKYITFVCVYENVAIKIEAIFASLALFIFLRKKKEEGEEDKPTTSAFQHTLTHRPSSLYFHL